MKTGIDISLIITYHEKYPFDSVNEIYKSYKYGIELTDLNYELIFVIDGVLHDVYNDIVHLAEKDDKIRVVKLGRWFGDATALQAGFENSSGLVIMTLPSYKQVDENEMPKLVESLESNDMIVCWRWPRLDSILNNIQSRFFNYIIKIMVGTKFHDLKCIVRVIKREVLENIYMYGDQDRFLPLWAWRYGYKIHEIKVKQFKRDSRQKFYPIGNYIFRILEIISLFFLIRFTKKPIRFFGSSGLIVFLIGGLLGIYLFIERFFLSIPLADRPILIVSLLLMILGILSFAIGLVGELIIFTHAKDIKDFVIEKVIDGKTKNSEFESLSKSEKIET